MNDTLRGPARLTRRCALAGLAGTAGLLGLAGCTGNTVANRLRMVPTGSDGVLIGSSIDRSWRVDASQFRNRSMKLRLRNTSGDAVFDPYGFRQSLAAAMEAKGYSVTDADDFGLMFDVNVIDSGRITEDRATQVALLGGAAGAAGGYELSRRGDLSGVGGTVLGGVAGATIGQILGSAMRNDTYIVVTQIFLGIMDREAQSTSRTIVFDRSRRPKEEEDEDDAYYEPYRQALDARLAVYAGGSGVPQSRVVGPVRDRLLRILRDMV
jgi:hypothetical protein